MTDAYGLVASDEVNITVQDRGLFANAGIDTNIYLGTKTYLNGSKSYSLGSSIKYYKWTERNTTLSSNSAFSYTGTTVGTHTVTLTVTDTYGVTATDEVIISTFGGTKDNFIVNAGADQNITTQESVTLDGSETYNLKYKIVKYEWSEEGQVLGTSATTWIQSLPLGVHNITLKATDITGVTLSDDVVIRVSNGTDLVADAGKDQYVELGEVVTFDGSKSFDPDGNITSFVWSENNVTLSTEAVFSIFDFTLGTHSITLTVTDNDGNVATNAMRVVVEVVNDTTPPLAIITSPVVDTTATLKIDIIGTASDKHLKSYRVLISPLGQNDFTVIAEGSESVTDDVLATLDATTLKNGIYDVSLEVTDAAGFTAQAYTRVMVEGRAKIGNFSFTITDFNLQVGGLPVQVNRTYSTLQRFEKLDFSYAWSVDYQNVKLQESIHPGKGWKVTPDTLIGSCFKTDKQHIVNISLPDGTTESFEYKFARECGHYFVGSFYEAPILLPLNGTEAKLTVITASSDAVMMNNSGELFNGRTLALYNPQGYRLTMSNGIVYELDQDFGIRKITDLRGDTLTYTQNGIQSSRGESLTFTRDLQNRITQITDLSGRTMQYHYDQNNNLDYTIDQLGQKTTYTYQAGHLLDEYIDPSGLSIARNIYDASGRLIETIDAEGNSVYFSHNITGREEIVTDKLGRTSLFVYDDAGNVLSQTNPLGETTTRTYDTNGNELTVTDPLGNTITNSYDANDNLLETIDALGNTETTTYNAKQSPTSISDKNGNTMSIVYNAYNSPRSMTTAKGATTTYYYDQFGNKTQSINEYNQTTTYTYDQKIIYPLGAVSSKGNLLKETRPDGTTITHTYDANSNLLSTTTTTAEGTVTSTSNTYDAFDRMLSSTDELGNTSTNSYDARGNKVSTTDSQGRTTTYTYNNHNKVTLTTYPDNTTTSSTYDAMDNLLSETNQEGETTSYEYDDADRLTKTTYPDGTTTTSEYDAAGRVTSTTDQRGNTTTYTYDAVANRLSTTDALGNTTTFSYDAQGNMLTATDALNQTTSYEYNALNQRIKTTYPDNTTVRETKNISGLPSAKIDEAGQTTSYGYDTLSVMPLLNQVTLANGATTTYSYDSQAKKTSQTDALNHSTSWSYKTTGELASETLPQGETKTFTYDTQGKQTQITDYANKTQKFIYDTYDKLVRIEYVDGSTVTYAYTPSGRLKTITDAQGTITNTYDSMGRLKSQTNPNSETITYTYDETGNITLVETPTQSISKTYDALNRLSTVTDAQGTTTYTYDAIGRQTQITYPNAITTNYSYDNRNRIVKIEHKDSNGTVLQSFTYTLDAVGNRTQIVEHTGRTVDYTYNIVNQLIQEVVSNDPNGNNTTTTFTYDDVGNLVTKIINTSTSSVTQDYTYNVNDQLTTQGSNTFTYDANGNLVSDNNNTYTYDDKNRLITVTTPTDTIEYSYDANDNRVAKITSNGTTTYLIDANTPYAQVITENKADGTSVEYTYGNDLLSDGTHNFLTDALGSTRGLVDNTEQLTDSYAYTPYGELSNHDGNATNSFLFTGEQLDSETDDYYLRARYYSPNSSRFLSRDTYDGTMNSPVTQNHYLYGGSNPSMYVDPSGNTYTASGQAGAIAISGTLNGIASSNGVRILMGLIQKLPAIATAGVRGLARGMTRDLTRYGGEVDIVESTYLLTIARLYARFGDHTEMDKIPLQVYGSNNLPEHQSHIFDAMIGLGSNGRMTSNVLTRVGNEVNDRKFLTKECGGYPRARNSSGGKQHCDEYPYSSTLQGGTENYNHGYVSTRLVSATESRKQGQFIKKFYNRTPVNIGDNFIVIPIGGLSGYFDRAWRWHEYN